jgi:hypothetical protein
MNSAEDWGRVRRARRLRTRIALVAAAVLALGSALVIAGNITNARAAAARPASPPAVPKYYVALPGANDNGNVPGSTEAVVGDTFSGKRLLILRPPAGYKFTSVTAGADDRTFVLGVEWHPQPPAMPLATAWYLVRITPGPKIRATTRKLPVPAPTSGSAVDTVALSPDGREFATLGDVGGPIGRTGKQKLALRVYSVRTGAVLRAWPGVFYAGFDDYATLSWTADGQLAFARSWFTPAAPGEYFGVRMLTVTHPAGDLVAASRLVWSTPVPLETPRTHRFSCAYGLRALVTADGKTVVCTAYGVFRTPPPLSGPVCPAVPAWNDLGFLEYSTATGKLVRTLYRLDTNCMTDGLDVLWTSATGDAVIGYFSFGTPLGRQSVTRFGVFSENKFRPLPVPPTTVTAPVSIAW